MTPVRQEDDVIASRRLATTAAVALVVALLAVVGSSLLLEATTGSLRATGTEGPPRTAGRRIANVEQTSLFNARDGLDLREQQRAELARARWLDRDAGVATMPIERAMDVVVGLEGAPR